ncbi:MAG: tRNA (adenosine(37)-N6)-threonylcarbamoyltransferase complex ATPase subunit type 1 TsaE [Clostridia bacterium]|nr:tRNA (adenosine(37)-N6)-threonylcarbamoyltransferase complex ATPase subunit type 1 TsaE [Clostridia bacterium]
MNRSFIIKNEREMQGLASSLANTVSNGMFIALFGDMGAGKTTFIRYFAAELGIDSVASPTFTVVRNYVSDSINIAHFDCYRLSGADELYALGFEDYLDGESLIAMEWSENCFDALPEQRLEIHINGSGCDPREVALISYGCEYDAIVDGIEL